MGRPLSLFRVHAESIQEVTLNVLLFCTCFKYNGMPDTRLTHDAFKTLPE